MKSWIFQGNPKSFKVDDYLLENEKIWWSIRQEHLAKHIQLNDEVFIWRSDGDIPGSGGIIARAQVTSLPQEYTNDDDSLEYWYEDVSGDTYLAVELKVLEEDIADGIKRTELMEHEHLADLMILRLKQNTNYLLSEYHSGYLRQMWYSRIPVNPQEIHTRFPVVDTIEDVIENMKRFEADLKEIEKLEKQLPTFQQWYYIHEMNLLAPSKFIGYKKMKGHLYVDKDAIAWTDGRKTVGILNEWFIKWESQDLKDRIISKLNGRTRKDFSINILKSEKNLIKDVFPKIEKEANEKRILPELDYGKRAREFNMYSDVLKARVLFEHLINGKVHRWLDDNILGLKDAKTNGRDSANILHYLGMRADYRGTFLGEELSTVIEVLTEEGNDYKETIRLLKLLDDSELKGGINSDHEVEQAEELPGLIPAVKSYNGPDDFRVVLQPTSDKTAQVNYKKTILNSIDLDEVKPFIHAHEYDELNTIYPSGKCNVWGVKNGKNDMTKKQYEKLQVGDLVWFYKSNLFYSQAFVTYKLQSQELSRYLWNDDAQFANVYFLVDVAAFNLEIQVFNRIVYGKEKSFPVMGFRVLSEMQTALLVDGLNVEDEPLEFSKPRKRNRFANKSADELLKSLLLLEENKELDMAAKRKARMEQGILRELLFHGKVTERCACCGNEFPVNYLITAHIKKRAFCTMDEKLDSKIVVPLCLFGCDAMFEKGLIVVDEIGNFRRTDELNKTILTPPLIQLLKEYENQKCSYWNEDTKGYFEWHYDFHVKQKTLS